MRKVFHVPEEDAEFLNANGWSWETIKEGNLNWLLIHDYSVCDGYNVAKVILALRIDPGYPGSQIDMAYFYPPLVRLDNVKVRALANQPLDGKTFQRWSRHRTGQNPWRPGLDCLETHIFLIKNWLEREFVINAI